MQRRTPQNLSLAFFLSVCLHLAIAMFFALVPAIHMNKQNPTTRTEPVVLELKEASKEPIPVNGNQSRTRSRNTARSTRPSLKALTPSFKPSFNGVIGEGSTDVDEQAPLDDPQSYGLNAKTYDKGNAIRGFLEAVYARVNDALIFDSILAQYNHFGTVYLQFEVDKRGVLQIQTLRASTSDRVLKVHVVRSALIPGLRTPLKKNLWLDDRESIELRARFLFIRSRERTTLWDDNPGTISGYSLTFRRFTPERAVPKNIRDHLVNGGIDYDLFAMYEAWQKYNKARERQRLDVDPFAIYKADPMY